MGTVNRHVDLAGPGRGEAVMGGWCGEVWPVRHGCLETRWQGEESGARSQGSKCWTLPSVPRGPVAVLGERLTPTTECSAWELPARQGAGLWGAWDPLGSWLGWHATLPQAQISWP